MDASITSPVSSQYGNAQHQYYSGVTSPSNSDGNHYASPLVSPGYWNSASPAPNKVSPQSHGSYQGSPNSTVSREKRASPPTSPPSSFQAPTLPARLGDQSAKAMTRKKMEAINKGFLEKSSMDVEREKVANRRLQSMMIEATRKKRDHGNSSSPTFGKHEARAFLTPCGGEQFATSSRKPNTMTEKDSPVMEDLKGSVDDFKCGFDRDREWAAKKHVMRIIGKLDNAA